MKLFNKEGKLFVLALQNWSKVVDKKFNKTTYPIKVTYSKEQMKEIATLWVAAENSVAAFEINMSSEVIISRLNLLIGFKAITYIRTKIITPN
ncbi:MAG: DUF721 domain-containing protein [Rickettsiaceae bacterium]|nr:DUF721 domain-containing protein [Rickettsiaceae bacterium]